MNAWRYNRVVAIIIIVCFAYQDLVWSQGGVPVWSKGQSGNFAVKTQPVTPQSGIAIPKDVAVTKEVFKSTVGDNTIINIQDAHASFAAQESIASILDSLVTNYELKLVAIEGSKGYIDTSVLRTFPDQEIRKNTAKYFMKKGKISAGEFFSITSEKEVAVYGIEDEMLYMDNVKQFGKIHEINMAVRKGIVHLNADLDALKEKIYSKELMALDRNSVLHKDGKIGFSDRWALVSEMAARLGVKYQQYENLTKLVESLRLEKGIDFQKANKERDNLIDLLSKKMAKQDLEQLVLKSLSFKQGKISQGEHYVFLQELAQRYNVDPEPYKTLISYIDYITLYESIDLLAIFEEVKKFEDSITEKMFQNDYQRKFHGYSRFISLVSDLYELKITNSDLNELLRANGKITAGDIASFLKDACLKYGVTIGGDYDLGEIIGNAPVALSFYKTAEERNSAILANTINKMNQTGQNVAALVTGGYHTKGLTELLKQKETSYVVLLPKFDSSKGERPYVAILTNKKEPYEKLLESGDYFLATTSLFASEENFKTPTDIKRFIEEMVLVAMAQAKLKGQDEQSVAKIWLDAFEARQRQLTIEGKPGIITRKELEGLMNFVNIHVVKDGASSFAIISIGDDKDCLSVVEEADGVGISIPTSQELAKVKVAKEILRRRKGEEPELGELEERVKKLEDRLGNYIGEKSKIVEYLGSKDAIDAVVNRARADGKSVVTKEYVISRLKATGRNIKIFDSEADVNSALAALVDKANKEIVLTPHAAKIIEIVPESVTPLIEQENVLEQYKKFEKEIDALRVREYVPEVVLTGNSILEDGKLSTSECHFISTGKLSVMTPAISRIKNLLKSIPQDTDVTVSYGAVKVTFHAYFYTKGSEIVVLLDAKDYKSIDKAMSMVKQLGEDVTVELSPALPSVKTFSTKMPEVIKKKAPVTKTLYGVAAPVLLAFGAPALGIPIGVAVASLIGWAAILSATIGIVALIYRKYATAPVPVKVVKTVSSEVKIKATEPKVIPQPVMQETPESRKAKLYGYVDKLNGLKAQIEDLALSVSEKVKAFVEYRKIYVDHLSGTEYASAVMSPGDIRSSLSKEADDGINAHDRDSIASKSKSATKDSIIRGLIIVAVMAGAYILDHIFGANMHNAGYALAMAVPMMPAPDFGKKAIGSELTTQEKEKLRFAVINFMELAEKQYLKKYAISKLIAMLKFWPLNDQRREAVMSEVGDVINRYKGEVQKDIRSVMNLLPPKDVKASIDGMPADEIIDLLLFESEVMKHITEESTINFNDTIESLDKRLETLNVDIEFSNIDFEKSGVSRVEFKDEYEKAYREVYNVAGFKMYAMHGAEHGISINHPLLIARTRRYLQEVKESKGLQEASIDNIFRDILLPTISLDEEDLKGSEQGEELEQKLRAIIYRVLREEGFIRDSRHYGIFTYHKLADWLPEEAAIVKGLMMAIIMLSAYILDHIFGTNTHSAGYALAAMIPIVPVPDFGKKIIGSELPVREKEKLRLVVANFIELAENPFLKEYALKKLASMHIFWYLGDMKRNAAIEETRKVISGYKSGTKQQIERWLKDVPLEELSVSPEVVPVGETIDRLLFESELMKYSMGEPIVTIDSAIEALKDRFDKLGMDIDFYDLNLDEEKGIYNPSLKDRYWDSYDEVYKTVGFDPYSIEKVGYQVSINRPLLGSKLSDYLETLEKPGKSRTVSLNGLLRDFVLPLVKLNADDLKGSELGENLEHNLRAIIQYVLKAKSFIQSKDDSDKFTYNPLLDQFFSREMIRQALTVVTIAAVAYLLDLVFGTNTHSAGYALAAMVPVVPLPLGTIPASMETADETKEKLDKVIDSILALPEMQKNKEDARKLLEAVRSSMPVEHQQGVDPARLYDQMLKITSHYRAVHNTDDIACDVYNPVNEKKEPVGHTDIMFIGGSRDGTVADLTKVVESNNGKIESAWICAYDNTLIVVIEATKQGAPFIDQEISTLTREVSKLGSETIIQGSPSDLRKIVFGVTDKLKTIHGIDVYSEFVIHPWDKEVQKNLKIEREIQYFADTIDRIRESYAEDSLECNSLRIIAPRVIARIKVSHKRAEYCFDRVATRVMANLKKDTKTPEELAALGKLKNLVIGELARWGSISNGQAQIDEEQGMVDRAVRRLKIDIETQIDALERSGKGKEAGALKAHVAFLDDAGKETKAHIALEGKRAIAVVMKDAQDFKALYEGAPYGSDSRSMYGEFYGLLNNMMNLLHRVDVFEVGKMDPSEIQQRIINAQGRLKNAIAELRKEIKGGAKFYLEEFVNELELNGPPIIEKERRTASGVAYNLAAEKVKEIETLQGISDAERRSMINGTWLVSARIAEIIEGSYIGEDSGRGENIVLVVDSMDPAKVWKIKKNRPNVKVIICPLGNSRSHWVIAAEQAGFYVIAGAHLNNVTPFVPATQILSSETFVIVDINKGTVIPNPSSQTLSKYREMMNEFDMQEAFYRHRASLPARVKKGNGPEAELEVLSDIGSLDDIGRSKDFGASGVGLFRTEWLYDAARRPTEASMEDAFLRASESMGAKEPLAIRLLDMREDKLPATLNSSNLKGCEYYFNESEDNEGRRVVKEELRSILRAYAKSSNKNINVLFPMVSSKYVERIKDLVRETKAQVLQEIKEEKLIKASGVKVTEQDLDGFEVGAMIETPAAASHAALLFAEFDFIGIGMNDFTASTLFETADRNSEKSENDFSMMHPEVLSHLISIAEQAKATGLNKKLRICGKSASSPAFAEFVMVLKSIYPNISVTAGIEFIPRLKEIIRNTDVDRCLEVFGEIPSARSADQGALLKINSEELTRSAKALEQHTQSGIVHGEEYNEWARAHLARKPETALLAANLFKSKRYEKYNWILRSFMAPFFANIGHEFAHLAYVIFNVVSGRMNPAVLKNLERDSIFKGIPVEIRGPPALLGMAANLSLGALGIVAIALFGDMHIGLKSYLMVLSAVNLAAFLSESLLPISKKYRYESDLYKAFGPLVLVGIPKDMAGRKDVIESIKRNIKKCEVVTVDTESYSTEEEHLAAMAKQRHLPAILIDKSFSLADIDNPKFKSDVYSVELTGNYNLLFSNVNPDTRESIEEMIIELFGPMVAVNLDEAAKEFMSNGMTAEKLQKIKRLNELVETRRNELRRIYNNMPMPKTEHMEERTVAIATTEAVAVSDMYFGENMNRANKKHIRNAFIYGDKITELEDAKRFVVAAGYKGNIDDIAFIDRRGLAYEKLIEEIAAHTGVGIVNADDVGIRAVKGEFNIDKKIKTGKLLEIKPIVINGESVYAAANSYQALLSILFDLASDGKLPPGVTKDKEGRGIFEYMPRTIPIDYEKEMKSYMEAMTIIRTAA